MNVIKLASNSEAREREKGALSDGEKSVQNSLSHTHTNNHIQIARLYLSHSRAHSHYVFDCSFIGAVANHYFAIRFKNRGKRDQFSIMASNITHNLIGIWYVSFGCNNNER